MREDGRTREKAEEFLEAIARRNSRFFVSNIKQRLTTMQTAVKLQVTSRPKFSSHLKRSVCVCVGGGAPSLIPLVLMSCNARSLSSCICVSFKVSLNCVVKTFLILSEMSNFRYFKKPSFLLSLHVRTFVLFKDIENPSLV